MYGGTKEEMQRLLRDAEKLTGKKFDISSYSDIVEAIHAVQTEMGITGTTAKEAATTIQGSVSSAKSAWQNLLVGIADDNQDFGKLVDNFVDSVATAAGNILPRVEQSLTGIVKLVDKRTPSDAVICVVRHRVKTDGGGNSGDFGTCSNSVRPRKS